MSPAFVSLLLSVALAEGAAATDSQNPIEAADGSSSERKLRVLDRSDARDACRYSDSSDEWSCDPAKLARVRVAESVWSAPVGLDVRIGDPAMVDAFFGNKAETGCFRFLLFAVSHPTSDIVVDWNGAVFVLNGQAIESLPGFARLGNAGLQQRTSTVPAGAWLKETIHPLRDHCLVGGDLAANADSDVVQLQVPVRVGEQTVKITWSRERHRGASEREAIALIPLEHRSPPSPQEIEAGFSAWTLLVGAVAGAVIGGGCGALLGLKPGQESGDIGQGALVGSGIGVGAGCALGGGAGLAGDWMAYVDRSRQVREQGIEQKAFELSRRRDSALARKRQELGLVE